MLKKFKFFQKTMNKMLQNDDVESLEKHAIRECNELLSGELAHLGIKNYRYKTDDAVAELGLDKELVDQLVDDYVAQVIKATTQFDKYLEKLQDSRDNHLQLDYTLFRELAHKNLGVARNLRIRDAEALLYELMKKEDLTYLLRCLEALKVCAIKLRPQCAYDTLQLIQLKNSL
jgi:hypothetical protein